MNSLHLVGCAVAVVAAMPPLAAQVAIPSHAALLNPTAPLLTLKVAVDGDAIHAVGVTTGQFPYFVHYARSQDGGRSFPLREVPLAWVGSNSPISGALGDLVADGNAVVAVVSMPWAGPWILRSLDQGDSWQPPVRVSATSLPPAAMPASLHANQGKVAVVWPESRSNGTLWANYSSDGGASWWPLDLPLDVGLPAGPNTSVLVRGHGASLHVIYNRGTTPWVAYHQYSHNGGATWLPAPQPISTVQLAHFAATPSLLVAGGNYGDPLLRSLDEGQTWGPLVVPGLLASDAIRSIAAHGNRILVVGTRGSTLPQPVLLQVSSDGGQTWLVEPYQVPMFRSATITAHVGPDALLAHFAFQDQRFPAAAIIQSDDEGLRWRLVTGASERGLMLLPAGFLALTGSAPTGVNLQVWVGEGHTRHGQGSLGAAGIEPQLRGEGTAGLGRTVRYAIRDVVGGAPLLYCWSAEPLGTMPLGGGTFFLQQLVASRLLSANGASGVPGAGSAVTSVTIPSATALAGVRLATQAVVLDAAANGGVAVTAVVESWVY